MDSFQESLNYSPDGPQLSNNELVGVYQALSSPASFEDIDTNTELGFIQSCIENLYDQKFRLINSEDLLKDVMLLNNKFVELIKYCINIFKRCWLETAQTTS